MHANSGRRHKSPCTTFQPNVDRRTTLWGGLNMKLPFVSSSLVKNALVVFGVIAAMALTASCETKGNGLPNVEPGSGGGIGSTGGQGGTEDTTVPVDPGLRQPAAHCEMPEFVAELGQLCGCHEECGSGLCVDGVCCTSACDGTCEACNVAGSMGSCSPIPDGNKPVLAGQCKAESIAGCGLDGMCDGSGSCRKYPDGTVCEAGKCDGALVSGTRVCSAGECKAGAVEVCTPFSCDPESNTCYDSCAGSSQCSSGNVCQGDSCGLRKSGATCEANSDCESDFCADGVCCTTACSGPCVSCDQVGNEGTCKPVAAKLADPNKICRNEGQNSCGTSGVCDGKGACERYSAGTVCGAGRCEGGSQIPASTCDGTGSCKASPPIPCAPFVCGGNACKDRCTADADCTGGNTCQNGSCGKKGPGQNCAGNLQCASNFCVEGICCDSACHGTCRSCSLSGSRGQCRNISAGQVDPRIAAGLKDATQICANDGVASCDRNGLCNGNGGCQIFSQGTECRAQSCNDTTDVYTRPSTCDGSGTCQVGTSASCGRYQCNGAVCADSCASSAQCVTPNTCDANGSCGKKANGATCSTDAQCERGNCEQGVCCATACTGSCFSCSTSQRPGECVAVALGGQDPANVCRDDGSTSCKNNGVCNGNGGCQKYASGTTCAAAFCTSNVEQQSSTCDGLGNCSPGTRVPCDKYICDMAGRSCYDSCRTDAECAPNAGCVNGSCGKKSRGASCQRDSQCTLGFCTNGFCCDARCDGLCESCALSGNQGTCSPVAAAVADDDTTCTASVPTLCGDNGLCDGARQCQKWSAATSCRLQTCPAGATLTVSASCSGTGSCPARVTQSCGTHVCNPTTNSCLTSCDGNEDCTSGNFCAAVGMSMSCGLKQPGASCGDGAECGSGNCVNLTCCVSDACGTCKTCANATGTCQNLTVATASPACAAQTGSAICQTNTGLCGTGGACLVTAAGTNCGTTCALDGQGGHVSKDLVCDGLGGCVAEAGNGVSCGYNTCSNGACNNSCTNDIQCTGGTTCQNQDRQGVGTCMPRRAKGAMCMDPSDCTSGNCVVGTCCSAPSCGACNSCGTGDCAAVTAGTVDAACAVGATTMCNTGMCAAGGQCEKKTCALTCSNGDAQAMACNETMGCVASGNPVGCGTTCTTGGDAQARTCSPGVGCIDSGAPVACTPTCAGDSVQTRTCTAGTGCVASGNPVACSPTCTLGGEAQNRACSAGACVTQGVPAACTSTCTVGGAVQPYQCVAGAGCTANGAPIACNPTCPSETTTQAMMCVPITGCVVSGDPTACAVGNSCAAGVCVPPVP